MWAVNKTIRSIPFILSLPYFYSMHLSHEKVPKHKYHSIPVRPPYNRHGWCKTSHPDTKLLKSMLHRSISTQLNLLRASWHQPRSVGGSRADQFGRIASQNRLATVWVRLPQFFMPPQISNDLDLVPIFILKQVPSTILITIIVNLSLITGTFPTYFKKSLATPLLKILHR